MAGDPAIAGDPPIVKDPRIERIGHRSPGRRGRRHQIPRLGRQENRVGFANDLRQDKIRDVFTVRPDDPSRA